MTIEQTVEIPASHKLYLDIPGNIPVGKAKVTIVPFAEPPAKPAPNPYEAIEQAAGFAKKLGSTLTVDKFLRWNEEDIALEEAQYRKRFHHEGED
jgi:hypothetical protein